MINKHKRAVTLVEIVVAMIILAVIMAGLANISIAGKRHILHTRARMTAAELGKVFLDPLQMNVRWDQWGSNCLSSSPTAGCPGAQVISGITYTPTYTIDNVAGTNLRRVELKISWNE